MNYLEYHKSTEKYILRDPRLEKLISLGPEKIAFSLLELSVRNSSIKELVNRLCSEKSENLKRYYEKLKYLSRHEQYYDWKNRNIFILQLKALLKLLEYGASTYKEGIEGIFAIFEADEDICESCHDDGEIGMFYEYNVCSLFVHFAIDCEDKEWIADEIIRLYRNDNYGCRSFLLKCIPECLPEPLVKKILRETKNV